MHGKLNLWLLGILLVLSGCSQVRPDYEEPAVTVNFFRALPASGMAPRFEIGLHIINPNDTALEIQGLSYSASLEGHRLLVGVARDLPVIDAYGTDDVLLQASTDVLSGISLIADLMRRTRETVSYELEVKLSVQGFRRRISVVRSGEISLAGRVQPGSEQ